ncbi:MAG: serine/threonine protein phosphatase [Candidatus Binataceae bacterium]|nr:serine/threonine protein phosphatase [Candidatus Binataceae bacterium]
MASRGQKEKPKNAAGRLFAIGDIHGCPDELTAMLSAIAPGPEDTVVFVGDYVDRGPSARDVIDRLIDLCNGPAEVVLLKGNHEDMMLSFLGLPGRYGDSFLFNGGSATLESYGVKDTKMRTALERIPEHHLNFFNRLSTSYLRPPYLFVHAGIMPSRQLEEQSVEDMLWIRQDFIFNPHSIDATVVFGHTPMREVMTDLPYKLGIDTGLVYGGKLSCIEFTEGALYQVARGAHQAKSRAIKLG